MNAPVVPLPLSNAASSLDVKVTLVIRLGLIADYKLWKQKLVDEQLAFRKVKNADNLAHMPGSYHEAMRMVHVLGTMIADRVAGDE